MKFLLDENIPPSLVLHLRAAGYEVRHVALEGLRAFSDFTIAEAAILNSEIIITHDTDFGTILALTGQDKPSVILFRWQKAAVEDFVQFLKKHGQYLKEPLENGALIVVDEEKIRIRSLPLRS